MTASLVWATPDLEAVVMRCARVSSEHPDSDDTRLLGYLIRNKHWSPFEMATCCIEITTTRDIARQMLRHRSFSFQELSQRYSNVSTVTAAAPLREARTQDTKKRQRSHEMPDDAESKRVADEWAMIQESVVTATQAAYQAALTLGIAKEVARAVLPEGLTMSKMYMTGTLRSWIHYCEIRAHPDTQKEHRLVAEQIKKIVAGLAPHTAAALGWGAAGA